MALLLESAVKGSFILLAGLVAAALLRRQSAALRHWVLAAVFVCAAAMPLLVAVVPSWRAVQRPPIAVSWTPSVAVGPVGQAAAGGGVERPIPPSGAARTIAAIWAAGTIAGLSILIVGFARLRWIASRCRESNDGVWRALADDIARASGVTRRVTLLQSDHGTLLVTWGRARPKIILPAVATTWSAARARIVLGHELAHIRRGDWTIQMVAELVRCAYWFNPLVWIACRRLRLESEQACDDAVLAGGVAGTAYAAELVDLARVLNAARQPWFPAPAMARPSSLERRVSAMLDPRINRVPITRAACVFTIAALVAVSLPIAALAQQAFSTLSGSVFDPSDAMLPATTVVLTNAQTKAKYEVTSDRTGRFEFVGLPAGEYALASSLPGFATTRATVSITGQDMHRDVKLELASLEETITVTDAPGGGRVGFTQTATRRALPACSPAQSTERIGGNIRPPMRVKNVDPIYPAGAVGARDLEFVRLTARLNTDGTVGSLDVDPVNEAKPEFVNAALDAVRQWEFDETLLNCVPVEVTMRVMVRFRRTAPPEAGAQVRLNLVLPNGARPQMRGRSGELMALSMPDVGAFGFVATVQDEQAGRVHVSLIEGTKPGGRVLDEKTLGVAEPPVKFGTTPGFMVSVNMQ